MSESADVPVVVVCTVDPVLRDTTVAGLLCDLPDGVMVGHSWHEGDGQLRRVVTGFDGVRSDDRIDLEHPCLSCATREDLVPFLSDLALFERPLAIVVALPVTADPVPAAFALGTYGRGIRVAACVAVVDGATFEHDLLGDDLLAERALALAPEDRRAVGEALARQVECADVVVTAAQLDDRARALLDHLVEADRDRVQLHSLRAQALLDRERSCTARRGDLRAVRATGAAADHGVWTLDLRSTNPMHPERLLDEVHRLGAGPLRGRGYFWLPTRPTIACAWDGAGGQLSIGEIGPWQRARPGTRLVITGVEREPAELERAFHTALMTDEEVAAGLDRWQDVEDGWDEWLGSLEEYPGHYS